jgi:hypothetical protein
LCRSRSSHSAPTATLRTAKLAATSRSTPATSSCDAEKPLARGDVKDEAVAEAIQRYGIDPETIDPRLA